MHLEPGTSSPHRPSTTIGSPATGAELTDPQPEVSIVMPCLNEAETLADCIQKARRSITEAGLQGEIIIADNGSTDGSQHIALDLGARVVHIHQKGYGSALRGGMAAARGKYIVIGDADGSYDFSAMQGFVLKLREGYDLVMGNRFLGSIKPGAMPALHRYFGNPVLTFIGRCFFKSPCGDFHCGMRGIRKAAIAQLDLRTSGMELASEMVVKASLQGLKIGEIPTTLSPDGRSRAPHLRSWRDGWRHLRFMLVHSPRWLFFYPGTAMVVAGTIVSALILHGPVPIGPVTLDIHSLLYSAAVVPLGFQAILFAVCSKAFGMTQGFLPEDTRMDRWLRTLRLEFAVGGGAILMFAGFGLSIVAVGRWSRAEFGALDPQDVMRLAIPGVFLFTVGCQVVLTSFLLGVLLLGRQKDSDFGHAF